jgi:hypothetical protein
MRRGVSDLPRMVAALAVCAACACASLPDPGPPRTGPGVGFYEFADSFQLARETNADPALMSPSVKRVRGPRPADQVREGFGDWCRANQGTLVADYTPMSVAGDQYLVDRVKRTPILAGSVISTSTCFGADRVPMAGFLNLDNANLVFYDKAQLSGFIERFWGPVRAEQEATNARAKASAEDWTRQAWVQLEERTRADQAREAAANDFRSKLGIGDETHCGMVVEMKLPIVKVQSPAGEKWLKLAQLFPPGAIPCQYVKASRAEP